MKTLKIIIIIFLVLFFALGCRAIIIFAPVYSPHKTLELKIHSKDSIHKK